MKKNLRPIFKLYQLKMENKNNLIQSLQNKIKQVVNPYYISELEIAIKESLNPQLSQNSVRKI